MQKLCTRRLIALAGIAGSLMWGPAANAVTVTIGLAQDNATIGAVANQGTNNLAGFNFGSFTISALGVENVVDGDLLIGNSISTYSSAGGPHTLYLYITAQGISGPFQPFVSTFGSNALLAGNTVVESTYLSLSNALWTGTKIGGDATFTGPAASFADIVDTSNLSTSGTYSVTELFVITQSFGSGNASANIDISATVTPLPAALPLFGSVLGGGLLFGRLRNRRRAGVQPAAV